MSSRDRLILRYTGTGPMPAAHVACVRSVPGTQVLEQSDRMLLVEGSEQALKAATRPLGDWVVSRDSTVPVPDTRKKIRGGPESG